MIAEEIIATQIQTYLREHHSIELELPRLNQVGFKKLTLKHMMKMPKGTENRYQVLIDEAEQLLRQETVNNERVKRFGETFFETIEKDIIVMHRNQQLRVNFQKNYNMILYREEELDQTCKSIQKECVSINDKEDLLLFIRGPFRDYLSKQGILNDYYDSINKLEVYTSINVDLIYRDEFTGFDYYEQHYQPLLEVMERLKSNMERLYQDIARCQSYDVPLKTVNFLANCKSLLLELNPFLINEQCSFNRLIFHIVKRQQENITKITQLYQKSYNFLKEITSDVFKSYFLSYMFVGHFRSIKATLDTSKQNIIKTFALNKGRNQEALLSKERENIRLCLEHITKAKRMMSAGNDSKMERYISHKICKKYGLLDTQRVQVIRLVRLIQNFPKYIDITNRVAQQNGKELKIGVQLIGTIKMLSETNELAKLQRTEERSNEDLFKEGFKNLQKQMLSVSSLYNELQFMSKTEEESYFKDVFFPQELEKVQTINRKYLQLETRLLNGYAQMQKDKAMKIEQTENIKVSTIGNLNYYFDQLKTEIGFEISNEDNYCEQVKQKIIEIEKAQYMLSEYMPESVSRVSAKSAKSGTSQNRKEFEDLEKHKINFEFLLIVYEGSLYEKILEAMSDKMDFQSQEWEQKAKKVQEMIDQTTKYLRELKMILKRENASKMHEKVVRIVKDRIKLYQVITDIYEEFLFIFTQCMSKEGLNIEHKGIHLFSKKEYEYTLMVYQFKNKLRAELSELQQLLIPNITKNYLIDEIYQPFIYRFNNYITFSEEKLLNFTLRLEHALNVNASQAQMLKLFEMSLLKPYSEDYFPMVKSLCQELLKLSQENQLVLELETQEVIVHNISQFKTKIANSKDHEELANTVLQEIQKGYLELKFYSKSEEVKALQINLLKNWAASQQKQPKGKESSVRSGSRASKPILDED